MLDVKGISKLERLFRVAAQLDVDKTDLQRCTDFVNEKLYDLLAHDVPPDMLELAYSGLADVSVEFRVDHFTEFEQTPGGAWVVAREYPLTGRPA